MQYIKIREMKSLDEPAGEWKDMPVISEADTTPELLAAWDIFPERGETIGNTPAEIAWYWNE